MQSKQNQILVEMDRRIDRSGDQQKERRIDWKSGQWIGGKQRIGEGEKNWQTFQLTTEDGEGGRGINKPESQSRSTIDAAQEEGSWRIWGYFQGSKGFGREKVDTTKSPILQRAFSVYFVPKVEVVLGFSSQISCERKVLCELYDRLIMRVKYYAISRNQGCRTPSSLALSGKTEKVSLQQLALQHELSGRSIDLNFPMQIFCCMQFRVVRFKLRALYSFYK